MMAICVWFFLLETTSTILCWSFFTAILSFGGIYTSIITNSICFRNNVISIIYLLTLFTAPTCFSHCSSIRIPMPEPFFFSSAALDQYPLYFLFVLYARKFPSLSAIFVSVIPIIAIFSSSAQLSRLSSFQPFVLSPLILWHASFISFLSSFFHFSFSDSLLVFSSSTFPFPFLHFLFVG